MSFGRKSKIHKTRKIPRLTAEEEASLYAAIASTEGEKKPCKPAILSIIPGHSERYIPKPPNINRPRPRTSLYDPEAGNLSPDQERQRYEEVFDKLEVTAVHTDLVEKETKDQESELS